MVRIQLVGSDDVQCLRMTETAMTRGHATMTMVRL